MQSRCFQPTMKAMQAEGCPFKEFLPVLRPHHAQGPPGDRVHAASEPTPRPRWAPPLLESGLLKIMLACTSGTGGHRGQVQKRERRLRDGAAATRSTMKGKEMTGL